MLISKKIFRHDLFFKEWISNWSENYKKIITLACINFLLTFFSEILVRSTFSVMNLADVALLVSSEGISTQGAINCLYTFFVSLIGVPLIFFKNLKIRYFFFLLFGMIISVIAQLIVTGFFVGEVYLDASRFFFDLMYLGSLKFLSFELFRPRLIKKDGFFSLLGIRLMQDVVQTIVKTTLLISIGLNN